MSSVCDDNQNPDETESEVRFLYQIFPILNPLLFPIPNFFDTVSDTYFETKFFGTESETFLKWKCFETDIHHPVYPICQMGLFL